MLNLLQDAWKDFGLEGAQMVYRYGPVTEKGVWGDENAWSVGWTAWNGIHKYGFFVLMSAPVFHETVADQLRKTYAEFRGGD